MHPCLAILEIVSLICEELATDRDENITGHLALACLTRMRIRCSIYEPSMKSLWYGLSDIMPSPGYLVETAWTTAAI